MYNCITYIYICTHTHISIYNDTSYTHPTFYKTSPFSKPPAFSPYFSRLLRGTGSTQSGARAAERPQETAPSRAQIKAQITRSLRCFPRKQAGKHQYLMLDFMIWFHEDEKLVILEKTCIYIYLLGFIVAEHCWYAGILGYIVPKIEWN